MRTLSSNLVNAYAKASVSPLVQLVKYNNWMFSNTINSTYEILGDITSYGRYTGSTCCISGDVIVTFFAEGNTIEAVVQGSTTRYELNMSSTTLGCISRPGVYTTGGSTAYLYYYDISKALKIATFNIEELVLGTADCVTNITTIDASTIGRGVCHAISATKVVTLAMDTTYGWYRPSIYTYSGGAWTENQSPYRFILPEHSQEEESDYALSQIQLQCSTAQDYDGKTFIYFSDPDSGKVMAMSYDIEWKPPFVALESDLSRFAITNSLVANSKLFVFGQFERLDDLKGTTYNMMLVSTNGETFAFNKDSVISSLGYPFQGVLDGGTLWLTFFNRFVEITATKIMYSSATTTTITDISDISLSDSTSSSLSFSVPNTDFALSIANGDVIELYFGARLAATTEYFLYNTYRVSGFTKDRKTGKIDVSCMDEASFLTQSLTTPFYIEIVPFSGHVASLGDPQTVYPATRGGFYTNQIAVDMWGSKDGEMSDEYGVVSPIVSSGAHADTYLSQDIKEQLSLVDYPVVDGSLTIKAYGWSSTENSGSSNDTLALSVITIEDEEFAGTVTTANFPKTYNGTAAGAYPVEFTFPDIANGQRIKQIKITFTASATTKYFLERSEITGISAVFSPEDGSTPWRQEEENDTVYLKLPGNGRPYIMFATQPLNAFDFDLRGIFSGVVDASLNCWYGLVGHGVSCTDYVVGRVAGTTAQILKVRDGKETVLSTAVIDSTWNLRFTHFGGIYKLYGYYNDTWTLLTSYEWDAEDGAMIPVPDASIHVGFYGHVETYSFRIVGFNVSNAQGILAVPDDRTEFASFPASGTVTIGANKYRYTSKTGTALYGGPFRWWRTQHYGEGYEQPGNVAGNAIDISFLDWDDSNLAYTDYLIGSSAGYAWKTAFVDWTPKVEGSTYAQWYDRSRWFCDKATATPGDKPKIYIGCGLLGVTIEDGEITTHTFNTRCSVASDDEIRVNKFVAIAPSEVVNMTDMIDKIHRIAGTTCSFPGDSVYASLNTPSWTEI